MPDGLKQVHPAEPLPLPLPGGGQAEIDVAMVPLIQRLWGMGLRTHGCCQDFGESIRLNGHRSPTSQEDRRRHADFYAGQMWLKMPLDDAKELIAVLGHHPTFEERVRRWTHPEAWMSICYLFPADRDGGATLTEAAQLHFPRGQLPELLHTLHDSQ